MQEMRDLMKVESLAGCCQVVCSTALVHVLVVGSHTQTTHAGSLDQPWCAAFTLDAGSQDPL